MTVSAHAVDVGVLGAVVRAALVGAGLVGTCRCGCDDEQVVEGDLSYVRRAVVEGVRAHLELHARRPAPAVQDEQERALLAAVETVKATGGAVEIAGVRIARVRPRAIVEAARS